MNKNKFLWIGLSALVVFGLLMFSLSRYFSNPPQVAPINLPAYRLTVSEDKLVRALVENFLNLYNNYSYKNYENIYSVAVYMTPEFYDRLPARLQQLDASLRPGESVVAVADPGSFDYVRPSEDLVEASMTVELATSTGQDASLTTVQAQVSLRQDSVNENWLIDQVTITEK